MTSQEPIIGPEGPAASAPEGYAEEVERFLAIASADLTDLADRLNLPLADVLRLALVLFRKHIELTEDPNVFVMVVRGDVQPYNTAFEALLDLSEGEFNLREALERLKNVPS